jgi:hypothetical protein
LLELITSALKSSLRFLAVLVVVCSAVKLPPVDKAIAVAFGIDAELLRHFRKPRVQFLLAVCLSAMGAPRYCVTALHYTVFFYFKAWQAVAAGCPALQGTQLLIALLATSALQYRAPSVPSEAKNYKKEV